MKNLLEHKRNSIIVSKPDPEWERVFVKINELLIGWGIDPDNIDTSGFSCPSLDLCNFEPKFLEFYIKRAFGIPLDNPLWRDIIKVEVMNEEPRSYHGSGASTTITTYGFVVKDKNDVLKEITGNWIYANISEVTDFMDVYKNETYMRLVEIRRLFPITIEY